MKVVSNFWRALFTLCVHVVIAPLAAVVICVLLWGLHAGAAIALAVLTFLVIVLAGSAVARCWKCDRAIFRTPGDNVSYVIWWGKCPRCGVGFFECRAD